MKLQKWLGAIVLLTSSVTVFAGSFEEGLVAYNKGNHQQAAQFFMEACDTGSPTGCFNLAYQYTNGKGVQQDYAVAAQFFTKACDRGVRSGCFNLAVRYANGVGVQQSKSQAKALFSRACLGGHQVGCDNYRILSEQGVL